MTHLVCLDRNSSFLCSLFFHNVYFRSLHECVTTHERTHDCRILISLASQSEFSSLSEEKVRNSPSTFESVITHVWLFTASVSERTVVQPRSRLGQFPAAQHNAPVMSWVPSLSKRTVFLLWSVPVTPILGEASVSSGEVICFCPLPLLLAGSAGRQKG